MKARPYRGLGNVERLTDLLATHAFEHEEDVDDALLRFDLEQTTPHAHQLLPARRVLFGRSMAGDPVELRSDGGGEPSLTPPTAQARQHDLRTDRVQPR